MQVSCLLYSFIFHKKLITPKLNPGVLCRDTGISLDTLKAFPYQRKGGSELIPFLYNMDTPAFHILFFFFTVLENLNVQFKQRFP